MKHSTAYKQGYDEYFKFFSHPNPYPMGSPEYIEWNRGEAQAFNDNTW